MVVSFKDYLPTIFLVWHSGTLSFLTYRYWEEEQNLLSGNWKYPEPTYFSSLDEPAVLKPPQTS